MPDTTTTDTIDPTGGAALADTAHGTDVDPGAGQPETAPDAPAAPVAKTDGPPDDIEELRRGYYRQADYTRKTQEVAEERRALAAERQALLELAGRLNPQAPAPTADADPTPETLLKQGPEAFSKWFLNDRKVQRDTIARLEALVNDLAPVAHRERVVGAFHRMAQADPRIADEGIRVEVARLLDTDSVIQKIAQSSPEDALNIAIRQAEVVRDRARLTGEVAAMKKTHAARVAAAPAPSSSGPATIKEWLSPLQAAERAMKEEGLI